VRAEIRQPEEPVEAFEGYRGIIISGSPSLASRGEDSQYTKAIYDLKVPILGFCFGHQEIAQHYGGQIEHGGREWGKADLHIESGHPLFRGLEPVEPVWMSHYDSVVSVGSDFEEIGHTITGEASEHRFAAIGSDSLRRYGFQFHPEVDDTVHGDEMIANFVFEICDCAASWSMEQFLDEQIERVREQVGEQSVFLLASGGVDSTVAAVLLGQAIGPGRLHLLHIDNGLMRLHESAHVLRMFTSTETSISSMRATRSSKRSRESRNRKSSVARSATPSSMSFRTKRSGSASSITCSGKERSIPTPSKPVEPSAPTPSRHITTGSRSFRR